MAGAAEGLRLRGGSERGLQQRAAGGDAGARGASLGGAPPAAHKGAAHASGLRLHAGRHAHHDRRLDSSGFRVAFGEAPRRTCWRRTAPGASTRPWSSTSSP